MAASSTNPQSQPKNWGLTATETVMEKRPFAGTISVCDDVSGLDLLLLDDVITTGASVREATRALLARGAASVTACALARVW